ncbi:MAG: SDR family oxidoreductase [Pseudomonadota bacterium]|nr:SDR family oxidoreductase [Pseudomonadota bacterium]
MNSLKKVVIFGATSAIAEHSARHLVAQGASVYCVGRSPDKLEVMLKDLQVRASDGQVVTGCLADLTDTERHPSLIEKATQALGGLDAALIAHGSLPAQNTCEADYVVAREEFEVNAMSVISLLTLLANQFEEQGRGVIAAISSVAGDRGRQSNYVYGAAKGMVSIFMQGLRNRLSSHGVDVVTIKPGFVDTPMTAEFDKSGPLWARPDAVAAGVVRAMQKGRSEVYLPGFWWPIMLVIKHIPEFIFRRLSL